MSVLTSVPPFVAGPGWMILAGTGYTLASVCTRDLSSDYSTAQLAFMRAVIAIFFIINLFGTYKVMPIVGDVLLNSIANEKGIEKGDLITKIDDDEIKSLMVKEFIDYYSKNIANESKLIKGVSKFLVWCKSNNISMAVCTNKTEHLAVDLLKQIKIYDYFEYVAGYNTFEYCKPDPRHLTTTIEILDGDKNKSIMIGDSETDANAAKAAEIPIILLKYGYTEKRSQEIYHNHIIKDFVGIEKIVSEYL